MESTESAAPAERHAGWNELFFDLVVVAGAGQLAHLLHDGPHPADLALFGVLYLAFWTTWAGFAVYGDIAASATRVSTLLVAMLGMAVMAASVHAVLTHHAVTFVVAYVALRWQAGRVWQRGSIVVDWPLAQFGAGRCPGSSRSSSRRRGATGSGRWASPSTSSPCWSPRAAALSAARPSVPPPAGVTARRRARRMRAHPCPRLSPRRLGSARSASTPRTWASGSGCT